MKSLEFNKLRNYAGCTTIGLILAAVTGCASLIDNLPMVTSAPSDLADLVDTDLDAGRKKLEERGYELVESGISAKEQFWWNEQSKVCVSLEIDDQQIDAINSIDAAECTKRIETSHKAPEKQEKPAKLDKADHYVYTDGQAKVNSPSLSAERQQLSYQGHKAVYWIKDASSGKGVEYWLSPDRTKCTALVFEMKDGTLVTMGAGEPDQCVKPRP
jgi:hypothetical protein